MRITIDIPDWAEGRHIYIFAGIELLAYRHKGESLKVKTGRCSMCGGCCMGLGEVSQPPLAIDGRCVNLVPDGPKLVCSLGSSRPFSCSAGVRLKNVKGCTETYAPVL
jgi:hypothetical protein